VKVDPLVAYQYDVLIRSYYKKVKYQRFAHGMKNITVSTLLNSPLQKHYRWLAANVSSKKELKLWLSVAYLFPNVKAVPDVTSNITNIQEVAMLLEAPEYHIKKDLRRMEEDEFPLFYALANGFINPLTFCFCVGWLNLEANPRDFYRNGMIQKAYRWLIINDFAMVSGGKIFITKNEVWDILKTRFKEEPDNYLKLDGDGNGNSNGNGNGNGKGENDGNGF